MATGDRGKKGSSPPRRLSFLTNDIVPGEREVGRDRRARQTNENTKREAIFHPLYRQGGPCAL